MKKIILFSLVLFSIILYKNNLYSEDNIIYPLKKPILKPEDKEITEDLIVAAINDAKQKGEIAAQEEMKSVTGGMPLPPGMKLPF